EEVAVTDLALPERPQVVEDEDIAVDIDQAVLFPQCLGEHGPVPSDARIPSSVDETLQERLRDAEGDGIDAALARKREEVSLVGRGDGLVAHEVPPRG